ncbi:class 1 fructose-bisphosphatase [Haloarcula sp. KBTZ06]|uniref:Fructose-1,6-bisphosphatase class 1 n=4 Tax=Haloarcula TaxID=2237 RepID=M0JYQ1_9EURY|nr:MULTISPECIES: class 1 fructose-bisphosphatase [Haloarcula]NHN63037.1 fructose-1,6-bisphosphatase [Haloarcula sp. JP-Z28]AJF27241.1 fructose 1,6-bisphosphatase [Haloarcula sp. CBA1115]EMA12436.1 fructose-1,6-bisphosphatase [Haloarcula californiae ATCC 33799]EMA14111.1 fructose-1,6-bisphosphatase [Haloarcula sinaiiensis ATCC 33800]KAA9406949.1 fructose-1,6-bisphosphatase [Haloarcula sp. CBA1131]
MNTLDEIERAVKDTAHYVSGNLANYANRAAGENPSGEQQVGGDVWADDLFFDALAYIDGIGAYASEERSDVVDCGEGYSIAIDPLDGSSNLASNNSVGTIIGVYDAELPAAGREMVASLMVLYGPYTTLTIARSDRDVVQEHLLRDGHSERWGQFELPAEATVVGLAGKTGERSDAFNDIAQSFERDLKLRYGGATVADLAQVLEYGGLFGYPVTSGYPNGKLRVHFESAPLAYLVEAAGGASSDGSQSLLDVEPDGIHDRTPTFLGNTELVDELEAALSET